jgi:hypothetical protein
MLVQAPIQDIVDGVTGKTTMRRWLLSPLAVLLGCGIAHASTHHRWTLVPHQAGIRVDLNSIEHGHFITGGNGSIAADTRAVVDMYGWVSPEFFWCSGPKMTFGPTTFFGSWRTNGPDPRSRHFDQNRLQAFVCHH